ncbi:hypothetical protein IJ117_01290 [Candidatus Saccharibacteria bacterium]|nr:hypothetical protein [Candidatus Saccharibacteria bacterium]
MDEKLAEDEKQALDSRVGGLYTGTGKSNAVSKKSGSFKKKTAGVFIAVILIVVIIIVAVMSPIMMIGTLKENLLRTLGFSGTVAILEEQAEYVTGEKLAKGVMPKGYAADLAAAGLEVGQVTAAGKFVRTDTYIANIDELDTVAAEGEYFVHGDDGELVVRFDDEIITADNFVAAVESSPKLYAAYSEALDISARYYYSDAVNQVYKNMGLTRGAFNGWQNTGDSEADQKSFEETLSKVLDKESSRTLSGNYLQWYRVCVASDPETGECTYEWRTKPVEWSCTGGGSSWSCLKNGNDDGTFTGEPEDVARQIVSYVASNCRDDTNVKGDTSTGSPIAFTAEENAAQILNTVISADEPYRAASAFMAVVESIERAQIDGDGPVNEMMNFLSTGQELTYVDMNTGDKVTEKRSILETDNFKAAVGDGIFSKTEANNLARDRVIRASDTASARSIEEMVLSTDGKKKSGDGADMQNNHYNCPGSSETCENNKSASLSGLSKVIDAMRIAMTEKNTTLAQSFVGGNRILEGGSFVSNTINQQVIGAMPSDAAQVAMYNQEVEEVLARKAEADRATKSPFDVSSPNTFMGSLVRKIAKIGLTNSNVNNNSFVGMVRNVVSLTGKSFASISGQASADDNEDGFATTMGEVCDTASTVGASCNLYGSTHNTVYTGHMDWTEEKWASEVSQTEMDEFVDRAMRRDTIVGTRSSEVCRVVTEEKQATDDGVIGAIKGFFDKVVDAVKRFMDVITGADKLQESCEQNGTEIDPNIATGEEYVIRGGEETDTAKKSGYALYSMVSALLEESESGETAKNHGMIMYLPDNE